MSENESKSFKDEQGLPGNQHAKKVAKAKADAQKAGKLEEVFYTIKGKKILRIRVRPNGAYSDFVASTKKLKKPELDAQIAKWKAENCWLTEFDLDEKCSEVQEKLAAQLHAKKK